MSEGHSQKPAGLKIPRGFLYGGLIAMTASWIPLSLIALARVSESDKPRVHIFQDMDIQPRYGAQDVNPLMPDGRAMREPVSGAVARGELRDDDHFDRGYASDGNLKTIEVAGPQGPDKKWFTTYPDRIRVHEVLDRGRERYDIFCGVCHGKAGFGDGMVHRRAMSVGAAETGWVVPVNLHDPRIREMPVGKIYHTITAGKIVEGNVIMPAYGSQISAEDRWAITAYVKALQWSQKMPAELIPADLKAKLDAAPAVEDLTPSAAPTAIPAVTADTPKFKLTDDEKKLVDTGKQLFQTKICFTCHQVDPAVPTPAGVALKAPAFMGAFWGTEREVHNGPGGPIVKVKLDTAYFAESIKQPMVKIVKGAIPGMAPLPTTDEEIKALEAYVKSLSVNVEK